MKLACLFLIALLLAAQPQAAASKLAFEVASVRPAKPGPNGVRGGCHGIDSVYTPAQQAEAPPLGRCVVTDARLSHLAGLAWGIDMTMLKSGPDWIARGDDRYNVEAEAENPTKTTEGQLLQMLQAMIIERFQMKFHFQPVTLPGFGLTAAKGGAKLRESKSADTDFSFGPGGKPSGGSGIFKARRYSMHEFVHMLSLFGQHGPGIDRTGLNGVYDFNLTWDNDAGPDMATALREQLGLEMRPEKVATSYFVIDSAKRPSQN